MSESEIICAIVPHIIWAVAAVYVATELLEQRRRETKTGEFEEHTETYTDKE